MAGGGGAWRGVPALPRAADRGGARTRFRVAPGGAPPAPSRFGGGAAEPMTLEAGPAPGETHGDAPAPPIPARHGNTRVPPRCAAGTAPHPTSRCVTSRRRRSPV